MSAPNLSALLERAPGRAIWFTRWHIARWMIHAALRIAPAGPPRTLLVSYLNAYGREVTAKAKQ